MVPNKKAWFWLCVIDIVICQVAWLSPGAIIRSLGKASPRSQRPITGALISGEAASLTGASGRNVLKQREECNEWIKVGKSLPAHQWTGSFPWRCRWAPGQPPRHPSLLFPGPTAAAVRDVRELSKDRGRGYKLLEQSWNLKSPNWLWCIVLLMRLLFLLFSILKTH